MTDTMSPQAELSTTFQDTGSAAAESTERSVALIGPNEASRGIVARALAGSGAGFVREFTAYPSKLIEVPRILEQNFNVVMIDVDSDESCALALVEALAAAGTTTVMVYSMRNQPDLMMRCMQAGARDFLPLPAEEQVAAKPAEPQRRDAIHVVEPVREKPAAVAAAPKAQAAPAPAAPAPTPAAPAPAVLAQPLVVEPPALSPAAAVREPEAAPAPKAEEAPEPQLSREIVPPSFGLPKDADEAKELDGGAKRKGTMGLLVVAVVVLAGLGAAGWFYLQQGHKAAAPVPAVTEAQPGAATEAPAPAANTTPDTTPDTTSSPTNDSAASGTPAKPAAGAPIAQTPAPSAPQPRGVAPDAMNAQLTAPSRIGGDLKKPAQKEEAAPAGFAPGAMQSSAGVPGAVFGNRGVKVAPAVSAISAGVAEGMLIHKTEPVYPKIAQDARVSGTVVIAATITKTGALQGLRAVSGPPMLVRAALEAARTWRYRPYMLDNQPIDVETSIRVVFNLDRR